MLLDKFILFFLNSFIYYTCIILLENFVFGSKIRFRKFPLSLFIMYCTYLLCIQIYRFDYNILIPALYLIQISSLSTLFIKQINRISYCYFLLFLIAQIINALLRLFCTSQTLLEFVVHIVLLIITILCCLPRNRNYIYNTTNSTSPSIKKLLLCVLFCCLLIIYFFHMMLLNPKTTSIKAFVLITSCLLTLLVICLSIIFPVLILKSNSNAQLKKINENYEHQLKIQAEHYQNIAQANFELRRFRHDFNNLKIGLDSLIENKKFDDAKEFLAITSDEIKNNSTTNILFDTGNGIVDALLSDKQRYNPDIKIIFEGGISQNKIEPTDLCILFGNTLDNAIEACNKLNDNIQKEILVTSKCMCNFMFLHITNPINEPIKIRNNWVISTKTDKATHGFGLYSLDKTIKKYDGELNLSCINNTFSIDISLPLK